MCAFFMVCADIREPPFSLSEHGYGSFTLGIAIHPKDPSGKSDPLVIHHFLDLEKVCYESIFTAVKSLNLT